jgi:hypothetical protein
MDHTGAAIAAAVNPGDLSLAVASVTHATLRRPEAGAVAPTALGQAHGADGV